MMVRMTHAYRVKGFQFRRPPLVMTTNSLRVAVAMVRRMQSDGYISVSILFRTPRRK